MMLYLDAAFIYRPTVIYDGWSYTPLHMISILARYFPTYFGRHSTIGMYLALLDSNRHPYPDEAASLFSHIIKTAMSEGRTPGTRLA